jgi:hypothetical protein
VRPLILISVLCLGVGLGLLFGYSNGATRLSLGYPLSGTSIHVDMTTTGMPALAGVVLTLLGSVWLVVAWFWVFFGGSRKRGVDDAPPRRREEPFQE